MIFCKKTLKVFFSLSYIPSLINISKITIYGILKRIFGQQPNCEAEIFIFQFPKFEFPRGSQSISWHSAMGPLHPYRKHTKKSVVSRPPIIMQICAKSIRAIITTTQHHHHLSDDIYCQQASRESLACLKILTRRCSSMLIGIIRHCVNFFGPFHSSDSC